jgi:hypothetical protein
MTMITEEDVRGDVVEERAESVCARSVVRHRQKRGTLSGAGTLAGAYKVGHTRRDAPLSPHHARRRPCTMPGV